MYPEGLTEGKHPYFVYACWCKAVAWLFHIKKF